MEQKKPSEHANDAVPYSTFKHTPSPWKLIKGTDSTFPMVQIKSCQLIVATGIDIEDEANAELIARAPELLTEVYTLQNQVERLKDEKKELEERNDKDLEQVSALTKENERLKEALSEIRHALYDRDTDDAILDCIAKHLDEAGFPYESED